MFGKSKYKYLQRLELANATLLLALITEMDKKGLIDGNKVMSFYEQNLDEMIKEMTK